MPRCVAAQFGILATCVATTRNYTEQKNKRQPLKERWPIADICQYVKTDICQYGKTDSKPPPKYPKNTSYLFYFKNKHKYAEFMGIELV